MIVGTGIDIAEVPRIAASLQRFGGRFLQRVYTTGVILYCDSKSNRTERLPARFRPTRAAPAARGPPARRRAGKRGEPNRQHIPVAHSGSPIGQ